MSDQTGEVEDLEGILSDTSAEPIKISFAAIKYVTKNFAIVIGEGGFGKVYLVRFVLDFLKYSNISIQIISQVGGNVHVYACLIGELNREVFKME